MPYDKNTFAGIYWRPEVHQTYYEYIAEHVILFTGWTTFNEIQQHDKLGREFFGGGNATKDYHGFNEKRKIYISYGGGNDNGIMSEAVLKRILNQDLDLIEREYDGVIKILD